MPKSTKRIILSDEQLNNHGFRILTAGIDLTDFLKNPVMYWMHVYPQGNQPDQLLPIGYWTDVQVDRTVLSAVPVFDDNDEFAMRIYSKVEHGTIRAASVGAQPIETSDDPKYMLPGQKLPTVIKSKLKEASIVDRGSNPGAVSLKLSYLINLSNPVNNYAVTPELMAIMNNAVAVGKYKQGEANDLLNCVNDAQTLTALKAIIAKRKVQPENVQGVMHPYLIKMAAKSYDDIDMKEPGGMREVRKISPDLYKSKFFEKHGRMPAEFK